MKREQIIQILKHYDERMIQLHFHDIADAIMAIPLDVPSKDEADKWADFCASNTTDNVSNRHLIKAALYLGATWMRDEIIRRNK
jgi:hypothetical protein